MNEAGQFDWDELGEPWWREAAADLGADERQMKFAASLVNGDNQSVAARKAGYGNDPAAVRQAGHKAARTNIVRNLVALADPANRVSKNEIMDAAERAQRFQGSNSRARR